VTAIGRNRWKSTFLTFLKRLLTAAGDLRFGQNSCASLFCQAIFGQNLRGFHFSFLKKFKKVRFLTKMHPHEILLAKKVTFFDFFAKYLSLCENFSQSDRYLAKKPKKSRQKVPLFRGAPLSFGFFSDFFWQKSQKKSKKGSKPNAGRRSKSRKKWLFFDIFFVTTSSFGIRLF